MATREEVVEIDLALHHDGDCWVAQGETPAVSARGETFEALDAAVLQQLRGHGSLPAGTEARVAMRFDFDTLPVRLRQYHTHYFNRRIVMTL